MPETNHETEITEKKTQSTALTETTTTDVPTDTQEHKQGGMQINCFRGDVYGFGDSLCGCREKKERIDLS